VQPLAAWLVARPQNAVLALAVTLSLPVLHVFSGIFMVLLVIRQGPKLAVVEGVFAGGLLALTLLFVLFRGLLPTLEAGLELVLGYATPTFLGFEGSLLVVLAGALLGVVGCAAALAQEEGLH